MAKLKTGHVGLNVRDVGRSRWFYEQVFDLEVLGESADPGQERVFLGCGGEVVLTLWRQGTGRFSAAQPGLHHLAFEVDTRAEVDAAEERLRRLGVPLHHDGIVAHGEGSRSGGLFFEDPDGIRLEIYCPDLGEIFPAPTPGAPTCGFF